MNRFDFKLVDPWCHKDIINYKNCTICDYCIFSLDTKTVKFTCKEKSRIKIFCNKKECELCSIICIWLSVFGGSCRLEICAFFHRNSFICYQWSSLWLNPLCFEILGVLVHQLVPKTWLHIPSFLSSGDSTFFSKVHHNCDYFKFKISSEDLFCLYREVSHFNLTYGFIL